MVRVISWFGSRDSSAKQTTKKHEHKTNPHEGRKAMSQVYYCRLNGLPVHCASRNTWLKESSEKSRRAAKCFWITVTYNLYHIRLERNVEHFTQVGRPEIKRGCGL